MVLSTGNFKYFWILINLDHIILFNNEMQSYLDFMENRKFRSGLDEPIQIKEKTQFKKPCYT